MMTTKREWVLKAFKNEKVDKVPVGFWYHFTTDDERGDGFNPEIFNKNIAGHKKFVSDVDPDFVKVMSDGFFTYPNEQIHQGVTSIKELEGIVSIGENHPWITQQVELAKKIREDFPEDIASFYNIFAPVTYLKWQLAGKGGNGDEIIENFIKEDAELTKEVLDVVAGDIGILTKRLIKEAGVDGIYLSVQNLQDSRSSKEEYNQVIKPGELHILNRAISAGGTNILHICGYEGATNDITYYTDYPADVINWAVELEGVSLSEGRQLFGGKTVLGGFENTEKGLLYLGSKEAIQGKVKELLDEAGRQGVVIGADCTVPSDISSERIDWVKEAVAL
ncbi:uroporphyrinogen decarboxylase [Streptococcus gallolyticus subsp. gallolyticus]|uniref:uroporphyrinogen decarboxylase family protein n=1 Tax=Streptococcus gallolyticus TaxID=315405 RepID=UPI0015666A10|nr:uroporphyrinogen decarboxylase family protein [Streptococcus gallolyticus]MCF1635484.1 uroporphyrinogen decarboxylase [Streptococcus gallolyticus]MCO7177857.1 uroporphyrinogen decarboxylase [Streptococcus gallolyticus]MCY7165519.1 uroporphyrinogen decarboxylase [Streptococcus gallolyticus subsp. gallolyticus]MCY7178701.1 uroporphyrinogen decarboxylase [Streptococcus gallolyticus subsp. gallolyticus]MCY7182617.1 uroporphyrinogen decarboxylase [Streptococcus gallolyticus subsp. gallolyticus]